MADDTGDVLRRSLDAVDRHRKRLIVGLGVTVVLLLLTFVTGARAARAGTSAVQAILAHFMLLVIWMTGLSLVVVIQITVMTKRILRAIELASKR
jgi:heme/copper-type cytochrome/quinol oxidase subunit 2